MNNYYNGAFSSQMLGAIGIITAANKGFKYSQQFNKLFYTGPKYVPGISLINKNLIDLQQGINKLYSKPGFKEALSLKGGVSSLPQYGMIQQVIELQTKLMPAMELIRTAHFDFSKINWSGINKELKNVDFEKIQVNSDGAISIDSQFVTASQVKQIINDTLEDSGLLSGQRRLEDGINHIFRKLDSSNGVIRFLIIYIITSLLQPFWDVPSKAFYNNVKAESKAIVYFIRKNMEVQTKENPELLESTKTSRIVSKEGLPIFRKRATKSQVIERCHAGTLVTILHKNCNWSYIGVIDEDGVTIEGWTFSRHLKPLVRKKT